MALLTVERSTPSPQESEEDLEVMSGSSGYEGFVATRSLIMFLPHRQWTHSNNKELLAIETHLKKLCKLSRPEDTVKLIIELENINGINSKARYLVLLTTIGYESKEECIILGTENGEEDSIKVGLVLPVWSDTKIKLDGDGGFIVYTADRHHLFKPTSVQSMWSALQMLFKYSEVARVNNFYVGGLSHTWVSWYTRNLTDNRSILNEWNLMEDIDLLRIDSPSFFALGKLGEEKDSVKKLLTYKLRELMLHEDLEAVSVKQLKKKVEEEVGGMDLSPYNAFLDQQMMVILKQMEKPSRIFDYLYLGSEWNAADLDELQDLGIGYILNVTREIDNFYPGMFKYKNIRVFDVSTSDLLKHWDDTYKFIKEAKMAKSRVLVHCKMGISRSASTVIAYAMKEYQLTMQEAKDHVKKCRNIINPNSGFSKQLHTYEAILAARNNEVWGAKAPQRALRAHRRSLSDPNIVLEIPHCDSPISCYQLDSAKKYYSDHQTDLSAVHPLLTEEELRKSQLIEVNPQTTEQKVLSYLESMAPYSDDEEDQGISENSPISNSNSSLSSPICLTPPDEAYLDKWRDGKVIPSSLPPKMSDQLVGKDIIVPSPMEREPIVDMAENIVDQNASHYLTPSRHSNFKPYTCAVAEVNSSITSQHTGLLKVSTGMSMSRSYPENLAQLASGLSGGSDKEEKEESAPRPVSVIGMSPSHRRVHSEAITVMPTQKDWQQMEERRFGKSMSLVITKQIESVKERVKEMEQRQARSTVGVEEYNEMRKSASCVNLRVHSRKGSVLSNFSSQESSRPISQLSAHEKEDEVVKRRRSNGSSPVNLSQINEVTHATSQEHPQETKPNRNSTSPSIHEDVNSNDSNAIQRDSVKAIIQDIEQKKAFSTQLSTGQMKKRPLSESLSCVVPHSPVMFTKTSIVYNKSLSQNSSEEQAPHSPLMATRSSAVYNKSLNQDGLTEEHSLSPPLKNRHHSRVRSYSSSPLTSPKLSPRLKRASPDASEVFDHGIISSIGKGCYSKEKLSRRRSLDIYQKHGDFNLTSVPSVSHLKRLFEETAKSQPSTSRSTSPTLKRSHSLRDLFISSNNSVYRSSSLRSKEKPKFCK